MSDIRTLRISKLWRAIRLIAAVASGVSSNTSKWRFNKLICIFTLFSIGLALVAFCIYAPTVNYMPQLYILQGHDLPCRRNPDVVVFYTWLRQQNTHDAVFFTLWVHNVVHSVKFGRIGTTCRCAFVLVSATQTFSKIIECESHMWKMYW